VSNLGTALMLVGLAAGSVGAQKPHAVRTADHPAKPPHVISIRFSQSSGMCYGYCYTELKIEPGEATRVIHSFEKDKRKCPDLKVRADLSDKHWKELAQLIDREALFALPERIGCPGCGDEVVESIEVRFSDHTKKGVRYSKGGGPSEIKALSARLAALDEKLDNELPTTRCGQ
jgi:hypothetical protein